jgi:hypothetical protein
VTVIVAEPVAEPDVAVTVVVPAATPLTTPFADTVATVGSALAQVNDAPAMGFPPASRAVAPNVTLWPDMTVAVDGDTVTLDAEGGLTVMLAVPPTPSMVAVITALPAPTAVTVPVDETVAIVLSLLDHPAIRPVSPLP